MFLACPQVFPKQCGYTRLKRGSCGKSKESYIASSPGGLRALGAACSDGLCKLSRGFGLLSGAAGLEGREGEDFGCVGSLLLCLRA